MEVIFFICGYNGEKYLRRLITMAQKVIHITDLYHPHADPDDHYDLAQLFALAKTGDIELMQVMIDHLDRPNMKGSPAIFAVYQLNHLTGKNVHVTLGANTHEFVGKPEKWASAPVSQVYAAEKIIEILSESEEKVYISIVGGCLDTAIALERAPELFREKCAGIVLNAGSAQQKVDRQEYNVALGRTEYSRIFKAPCPVYWNPCLNAGDSPDTESFRGQNATYYHFLQKEVFSTASDGLVNFFLYMLTRSQSTEFLKVLEGKPEAELVEKFSNLYRNMWCTGSIFDMAGKTVTMDGEIVEAGSTDKPVFEYKPICVTCDDNGMTKWEFTESSEDRFIFHINDQAKYEPAMTKALVSILKEI